MGTLSNKYFNAQAVEEALDKGVAAYDNMGQIELVYNGTDIRFNNEVVNFQQIVDYITTDARFCYMVYNNRVLLTSDMQLTGGTRYIFFETSTTDSGLSKNTVVKVYSADGTTISSISHSTIANENFNNKVSTIAPNDKNSTVHYPNNKAVTEITDELKEDLTELSESINEIRDNAFDIKRSHNVFDGEWIDGYINMTGQTGGTGYGHSNPILTNGASAFTFTREAENLVGRYNAQLRFVTAFDSDGNVISAKGMQNVGSNSPVTNGLTIIPLDASIHSIVISYYNPTKNYNYMLSFDTTITEFEEYGDVSLSLKENVVPNVKKAFLDKYLNEKKIAVFGDSIMFGAGNQQADGSYKGIGEILEDRYGAVSLRYAVSGSTMGVRTDSPNYSVDESHHIAKQVRMAIADSINPDIIIFNGGTNDVGGNIEIGEISEVYTQPSQETIFANGFETVAYLLKTNFRHIPIIYIRAHNMSSRAYDGQIEYGEVGVKIAEKWGFGVVDMYKSMNTQLISDKNEYLADYTHPNAVGYDTFYIKGIENWLYEHEA